MSVEGQCRSLPREQTGKRQHASETGPHPDIAHQTFNEKCAGDSSPARQCGGTRVSMMFATGISHPLSTGRKVVGLPGHALIAV